MTEDFKQPLNDMPLPVCAIGASAGGISALQALFRQLPPDLGLAYVVILHLAPDHPSALSDILAGCTRMSVCEVDDAPELQANHVYVIPPDRELVIEGDSVTARPFSEPRGRRSPIDMFFRSVAAARGDGMAVVLSGSGSDGTNGVRAVKEAGGVVMVQEPAEAGFPSMPQSIVATGIADFVAPVARLAECMVEVARSKEAVRSLDMDSEANELRRIIGFLRSRTGHDFSSYKRATIMRRVMRRMQVCGVLSLENYAGYLLETTDEAKELFSDLLISVTQFFRDPKAFETLRHKVIHPLFDEFDSESDEPIRVWVVGCATGEEAYSIAILLHEEATRRKRHANVQIFASDLDEDALLAAREGRYLRSIEVDVSEERLARFFIDEGTHYRVRKELRESVLFASHSVIREPPFMRLDLIACRNLLIYLERALQSQLCSIFHYGLKPGHFLFLGSAETADAAPDLFATLDRDARIYGARTHVAQTLPILPQFAASEKRARPGNPPSSPIERARSPATLHASALERYAPASVLVDDTQTILHLSPSAGRFILHSAGPMSSLLPAIVRPELRLDLRLALNRAFEHGRATLTHPTVVSFEAERRRVAMHVAPVPTEARMGAHALVLFLDDGDPLVLDEPDVPGDTRPDEVRRLHVELKAVQEALVASRGSHDISIQDLRASNEELQSINEEYRSTAEELETSKEELQSINEELHTVNADLKSKLASISIAHSDLQNLTAATEIGTLFLDPALRIKMFTPPIADLFNITKADVGRTITDFTHRLEYDGIGSDAIRVLKDLTPYEREVRSLNDRWYVARLRPYRTVEDRIDGTVVSFVDITERRQAETALRVSEARFSQVFVNNMVPMGVWTLDGRIIDANDSLLQMLGFSRADLATSRMRWDELTPRRYRDQDLAAIAEVGSKGSCEPYEKEFLRKDGSVVPVIIGGGTFGGDSEVGIFFAVDLTARKRAESALREAEERHRLTLELVPAMLWWSGPHGLDLTVNHRWKTYSGQDETAVRNFGWLDAIHPDERQTTRADLLHAYAEGSALECQRRIRQADGQYRWHLMRHVPVRDEADAVVRWFGAAVDIQELRQLQDHQGVLLHELQHRVRNILALLRSIARRTGETSETVEDFAAHLDGRLDALARTQALLARKPGEGVDLELMVRDELLAQTVRRDRVVVDGPTVILAPKCAEVLTMAIHELATNSVKYGALSSAGGRVDTSWRVAQHKGEDWLCFSWTESGVALASMAPRRSGFGTELLERLVPYELRGRSVFEFRPGGVRCAIEFPLRISGSLLETDEPLMRPGTRADI